ncbi:MAG: hypothetical protein AAGA23_05395 [Pseudomonadota bacterium]
MNRFIPFTDSLLDHPELLRHGRLVPYHVDRPCFRWALGHVTEELNGEVHDTLPHPSRGGTGE